MRRVFVIDGYNVLHAAPGYRSLLDRDPDAARIRLVADVAAHSSLHDHEAIIVFDGAGNPASDGSPHLAAGVTVVFSPYGRDADEIIEQTVAELAAAGADVVVVTSDAETQWVALGYGATRQSSASFTRESEEDAEELRRHVNPRGTKGRLEDALDLETRAALSRWARGE